MGEMIDIRKLDREVQDMMDPMATGSLFRRVQQRNNNDRSFTDAEIRSSNPNFEAYNHTPFEDGSNTPSAEDFLNGIVRDADVYANMSEDGVNPDSGYVNPAGINPSTGEFVSNPNYVPEGGVGEETNAEPKTDLYRVIQSELQSLDDGMSLTGAERMVQAFDQIFAKYENADAEIANMFLGKNNVRKETAYSPFLGR